MGMKNYTLISEFILLGIPHTGGQETVLFVVYLIFYLCTLLGNLLTLLAVLSDSRLHTLMYFFLWLLLCEHPKDVGQPVTVEPTLFPEWLHAPGLFFLHHFLSSTECLLCTVMAYDLFATTCDSLRYNINMNHLVCALLAAVT